MWWLSHKGVRVVSVSGVAATQQVRTTVSGERGVDCFSFAVSLAS